MTTPSSVLALRIPGMVEPGGLPSVGLHRVGHDWSDLAAAAAAAFNNLKKLLLFYSQMFILLHFFFSLAWIHIKHKVISWPFKLFDYLFHIYFMLSSLFPFFFSLNFSLDIVIVLFSTVLSLSSAVSDLLLHPSSEFLVLDMVFFISIIYISKYTYTYIYSCHSGKECACQCRRHKRCGFNPWVGKIPWSRKWQPIPVFLPGKFYGQRAWWSTILDVTWAHIYTHRYTHMHIFQFQVSVEIIPPIVSILCWISSIFMSVGLFISYLKKYIYIDHRLSSQPLQKL